MRFKKPIINHTQLESFRVRISQIPAFDVAFKEMLLSDYEMLVATINRLNELIEINQEYIDLTEDVLEWVLNDGLSEAVYERLLNWRDDGTLDEIINDLLFKSKLDKDEFNQFKQKLNTTLDNLKATLIGNINSLESTLTGNINSLESTLTGNINSLESTLTGNINSLETTLTGDINTVKNTFNNFINSILIKEGELYE